MRNTLFTAALAATALFILHCHAACAETPGEACDRLATQSSIKTKPANVAGVKFDDIDMPAAMKACAEAIAAQPDVTRYHIQYGRALNKAGKNDQAIAEYEIAKKAGHWEANIFIGDIYFYGDLGKPDYEKAFALNLEAAEHGVAYAAGSVGIWYRDGLGVAKDSEKALQWFRKAHELGDTTVAVDIGWAYENGFSVPVDYVEAMRWYQIGAKANNAQAINNIGGFYARGVSVAQDDTKALVWYRKAQALGNPLANINLASYTDRGKATDRNPSLAVDYVLKALEIGDKWEDPRSADTVLNYYKWSPEFWRIMQEKLKERGHYNGPIDGQLTEATKAAFEKIVQR